ncbi:L,D-transpeptidase [Luteipulveratus mongoliensis]|uniref:L,D-transpeptidase n=1 Tax=Luteipulveratus mongoliensis TaxID=571913 RepID=UPI000697AFA2|nr:L,D-transpeptidase [Luteipulveratus mongoliensis]
MGSHQNGGSEESGRSRLTTTVVGVGAGFAAVALLAVIAVKVMGSSDDSDKQAASKTPLASSSVQAEQGGTIPVPDVPKDVLDRLPQATTDTKVSTAPIDLKTASGGHVVNVATATTAFAKPGAQPVTIIPAKQIHQATWLPVIGHQANWIKVRLPARPNGASAWIPDTGQKTASTAWSVRIDLSENSLTVDKGKEKMGQWSVGHGLDSSPTPQGETFLLTGFVDPKQTFSPVIYALGAHSDTLDSYGGGPGTVAVHGWPTKAGRTGKISHGCVRVPEAALDIFGKLPAGTPVSITA